MYSGWEQSGAMEDEYNLNRRKVLGNIAAAGSVSLFGMTASVGATPKEASVDIDRLLESDRINKLNKEIPGLELSPEDTRVIGGEQSLVIIPANHGTALTRPPGETDAASFYFDEWVPGVDSDWVKGTHAQLRVTDNRMVLTRTATDRETEEFLSSVGATEFDRENTTVGVQPETGKVTISHTDPEDRRFDRIQAEPAEEPKDCRRRHDRGQAEYADKPEDRRRQHARGEAESAEVQTSPESNGLAAAKAGLEVTDRQTEHFSGSSQGNGMQTQASCDQDDVIFCIIELASCAPCGITSMAGPVLAACLIVVCAGFPHVQLVTFLADIGCTSLLVCGGEEAADIAGDIVDEYGDEIPV